MATDVVPVLNERIQTSFQSNVMKDRQIAQISKRIRDGTATFVDGHKYAERVGENLSKALVTNLNANTLPDSKLYYNIAKRTVTPALENNYNLTNDVAADIQKILDESAGIGHNAVRADFPKERIQGLIDKMTADGITLEEALVWLAEPIINNSEAFFDDFIDSNAKFRNDVGLKATLTRTADPKCCDWCAALEGTYDYDNAPEDIYRRHEYCRCTVTYQSGKKSQNVWTKKSWESTPEQLEERKTVGQQQTITPEERIDYINEVKTIQESPKMTDKAISNQERSEEKAKDLLFESYENNRIKGDLSLTPADELKTIDNYKGIGADYNPKRIAPEVADAFNESIEDINKKYVTTVTSIKPMSSMDAVNFHNVYSRSYHNYSGTNNSEIEYNPLKVGNAEKLKTKISELKQSGYIPDIDDNNLLKYVPTHELGHTILDIESPLGKNFANADYGNVKAARKEIKSLFNEYTDNHARLESQVKEKLNDFLNLDDQGLKELETLETAYNASSISKYSLVNADEFIAEAYADATLSKNPNEWSLKVTTILNKYFGL